MYNFTPSNHSGLYGVSLDPNRTPSERRPRKPVDLNVTGQPALPAKRGREEYDEYAANYSYDDDDDFIPFNTTGAKRGRYDEVNATPSNFTPPVNFTPLTYAPSSKRASNITTEDLAKLNIPTDTKTTQSFWERFKNHDWGHIAKTYGVPVLGLAISAFSGNLPGAVTSLASLVSGAVGSPSASSSSGGPSATTQLIQSGGDVAGQAITAAANMFGSSLAHVVGPAATSVLNTALPAAIQALREMTSGIKGVLSDAAKLVKGWVVELTKSEDEKWRERMHKYGDEIPYYKWLQRSARKEGALESALSVRKAERGYLQTVKDAINLVYNDIVKTAQKEIDAISSKEYEGKAMTEILSMKYNKFMSKFKREITAIKPPEIKEDSVTYQSLMEAIELLSRGSYIYAYETSKIGRAFTKSPLKYFNERMDQLIQAATLKLEGARNQSQQGDIDLIHAAHEKGFATYKFTDKGGKRGFGKFGRHSRKRRSSFIKGSANARKYMAYVRSFRK